MSCLVELYENLLSQINRFVYSAVHVTYTDPFLVTQNVNSENVDPELETADETRSNKRPHDDVTTSPDVEDIGGHQNKRPASQTPTVTKHTLTSTWLGNKQQSWREVLGPPPPMGTTKVY